MKRFASVRFDGVLGPNERDEATRSYISDGATVTSWKATGTRTYVTFEVGPALAIPALAVLRVTPNARRRLPALHSALGGAGAPAAVYAAYLDGDAVVVEFDPRRTSLSLVVATIDAELRAAPGRTIEPLVPIDDDTLCAFAGDVLGEPLLDVSRLIETYLDAPASVAQR